MKMFLILEEVNTNQFSFLKSLFQTMPVKATILVEGRESQKEKEQLLNQLKTLNQEELETKIEETLLKMFAESSETNTEEGAEVQDFSEEEAFALFSEIVNTIGASSQKKAPSISTFSFSTLEEALASSDVPEEAKEILKKL